MNPYQQRMDELEAEIVRAQMGVHPLHLSEEEIASAEVQLGHPLPSDYRVFLQDFGCYSLYAKFPISPLEDTWVRITLFLGVTPLDSHPFPFDIVCDLVFYHDMTKDYLPSELICIAGDGGPNHLCIALSGKDKGAVYWWDRMVSFDSSDYSDIYWVAPSFDEFMKMLLTQEQYERRND